jgi:lipopolysaccharide transport system permease protein
MDKSVRMRSPQPASLVKLVDSLWCNRDLILRLTQREILGRYNSSVLGLVWSLVNPMLMLVIYTFVFSEVFKSRWGDVHESKTQFAIVLFVGMIILGFFSEVINRAPYLILQNVSYVKKVVFPIEILPVVAIGTALFHSLASFLVLVSFVLFWGSIHWTIVFIPLVFFPLIIMLLGVSWMLASIGVFSRDIGQAVGVIPTVFMFISPIFYSISAVPEKYRFIIMLNPLTFIIEQARDVVIFGHPPDFTGLLFYTINAVLIAWAGYYWFQKTKKGFADVL